MNEKIMISSKTEQMKQRGNVLGNSPASSIQAHQQPQA